MIITLLADGFEEIEALTPVDTLRRCGLDVRTVGVTSKIAVGSHGISVICDLSPEEVPLSEVSMAIFPGGMPGALNLDASPFTDKVIEAVTENGGRLAAICAAPLIFGRRGLLKNKLATCYPGFEEELKGAFTMDMSVVTDGNITTAKGMGVALDFSLELIKLTLGEEKANEIASGVMLSRSEPLLDNIEVEDAEEDELLDFDDEPIEEDDIPLDEEPFGECSISEEAQRIINESSLPELREYADGIVGTLTSLKIPAKITDLWIGPRTVTLSLVPDSGVRVYRITKLEYDLTLALNVYSLRMIAPIPGKSAIGIELPRRTPELVNLSDMADGEDFAAFKGALPVCIGKDTYGKELFCDVAKMPHALIAGATGMGKSVCIHSLLISMIGRVSPENLRLILIDPKAVEFTLYEGIPHLLSPVINDVRLAAGALGWAVEEMERRYTMLMQAGVRSINGYNELVAEDPQLGSPLPYIVIVIEELYDLMLQAKDPIESLIVRLVQKARAAGIHLILGTLNTSPEVLTGLIRSNIPTRICFRTVSHSDSMRVLNDVGADKLLGHGDMLLQIPSCLNSQRVQGAYVSVEEIMNVSDALKKKYTRQDVISSAELERIAAAFAYHESNGDEEEEEEEESSVTSDPQFISAVETVLAAGRASTALLQRKLSIGYGKAARFIDAMEEMGIVSAPCGQRPRELLINGEEWQEMLKKANLQ